MEIEVQDYVKKIMKRSVYASGRYNRSGMPWRSEQTFRLIELYQSMPCLWDWKCEAYKDRQVKHDARQKMANELGVDVYEVEKKLHSLKSQFRREHKKIRGARKNGHAPKECAWFGYKPLMFLLQADGPSGSCSTDDQNLGEVKMESGTYCSDNGCDDSIELKSEGTDEASGFQNQYCRIPTDCMQNAFHNRKAVTNGDIDEAYDVVGSVIAHSSKRDEYSVYGEHVGNKLRNCGRKRHDVAVAQHKIDDILFRLEMGEFNKHNYHKNEVDNQSSSPVSHPSPLSHIDYLPVESVLGDPDCSDAPLGV